MSVELIPVLEIVYSHQELDPPERYPPWQYPEEWEAYRAECYRRAGFLHPFRPYRRGLLFYRPLEVHEENLRKILRDHLQVFLEGARERDQVCPLSGGYVLRIDGVDELFPQCCGDLSDIRFWERVSSGEMEIGWEGHPCPSLQRRGKETDLLCQEDLETFFPETRELITVDPDSLAEACRRARSELRSLAQRIETLGRELEVPAIADLLIYGE